MHPIAPSRTIETRRERRIDAPQTTLAMRTFLDNVLEVCALPRDGSMPDQGSDLRVQDRTPGRIPVELLQPLPGSLLRDRVVVPAEADTPGIGAIVVDDARARVESLARAHLERERVRVLRRSLVVPAPP